MLVIATLLLVVGPLPAQGSTSVRSAPHSPRAAAPRIHPWPMRFGDPARTGRSGAAGAQLGQLEGKTRIAGVVPQIAVAADGTRHCGSVFHEEWWSNELY